MDSQDMFINGDSSLSKRDRFLQWWDRHYALRSTTTEYPDPTTVAQAGTELSNWNPTPDKLVVFAECDTLHLCKNGATCMKITYLHGSHGPDQQCICASGYDGEHCQYVTHVPELHVLELREMAPAGMNTVTLVGVAFFLAGLLLIVASVAFMLYKRRQNRRAPVNLSTISQHSTSSSHHRSNSYYSPTFARPAMHASRYYNLSFGHAEPALSGPRRRSKDLEGFGSGSPLEDIPEELECHTPLTLAMHTEFMDDLEGEWDMTQESESD